MLQKNDLLALMKAVAKSEPSKSYSFKNVSMTYEEMNNTLLS